MSKAGRDEVTAIRYRDCPLCGAEAGQWCISRHDGFTLLGHPHPERIALVTMARPPEGGT